MGGVKHYVVLKSDTGNERDGGVARMNINRCGTRQRKDYEGRRKDSPVKGGARGERVNGQQGDGREGMGDGMGIEPTVAKAGL